MMSRAYERRRKAIVLVARHTEIHTTVHRSRVSGCVKLDCRPGGGERRDISLFSHPQRSRNLRGLLRHHIHGCVGRYVMSDDLHLNLG